MRKGNSSVYIGIMTLFFAFGFIFSTDEFNIGDISQILVFIVILVLGVTLRKKSFYRKNKTKNDQTSKTQSIEDHKGTVINKFSVHCIKCNALISSEDKHCSECGAIQKDTIKCEYCGHENPRSNALCEKCNGFL